MMNFSVHQSNTLKHDHSDFLFQKEMRQNIEPVRVNTEVGSLNAATFELRLHESMFVSNKLASQTILCRVYDAFSIFRHVYVN